MKYNQLGQTELRVSELCLGTMTFGEQNTEQQGHDQLDRALDYGINFIDTAEMYAIPPRAETFGQTETIIGRWFRARKNRDRVVLATKVIGKADDFMPYVRGGMTRLNKHNIELALNDSLMRLNTDVIDLYQIHWPDRNTNFFGRLGYQHQPDDSAASIEETLSVLNTLVASGKVRAIGVSNETAWGAMEYIRLSSEGVGPRIASIQNPYNLLNRSYEVALAEVSHQETVGLLAYSPLAFGVLSGKYLANQQPDHARLTLFPSYQRYSNTVALKATKAYVDLAKEAGLVPSQMALAYVNSRSFVAATIIGATTLAQLQENIASTEVHLSDDVIAAIDAIHQRWPNPCP
ncbi:MAG TPA: NADP(H)-dependent aldo-keto reductase [Methylococcaceae bacterium]|jgi:aryl-alcohol dehydrogenase-like predicted oxidoreductase|nr:NADP(H)-dependent aldo-keto reductase [Methylococcaceae bacterium]